MNFVIAAGGTGGHLFPGLAVGEVLVRQGHEVMLIVSEKEIDTIATEGRTEFAIERVPGEGLQGKSPLAVWRFLRKFQAGLAHCRKLFAEFAPAAVLGMGGFTSLAPILAARGRKRPAFVHESNAIPGKANRLNARFCTAVLLGFDECAKHFGGARTIVTGTPIRSSLSERMERAVALGEFGLDPALRTLLVMGGSQGAHGLNEAMRRALPSLVGKGVQVLHLAGRADEAAMRDAYQAAGVPSRVLAFFTAMEKAYGAADFCIARSGAASLTELSHFGLPTVLVPYPFAAEDHQTFNAKIFERAGAAVLCPENELSGGALAEKIQWFLEEPSRLPQMSARMAALAPKDAAGAVARVITEYAKP
jgi:UDP-N-acetylglucosamine--N-acetylmuramyl-(pentapeptide) pyrophosphoryl-undecaprenol N-acetylglucosamine transferase